jgi:hypothetical protein
MWRQRIRLWSAVAVCAVLVPAGFLCYLIGSYLRGLWRDITWWRQKRRLYLYSQGSKKADV